MARDPQALEGAKRYQQLVQANRPHPRWGRDLFRAFLVGGLIGVVGQAVLEWFLRIEPAEPEARATTLAVMIFLGAVATAFGVYDRLGEWGGMGAAVPITGFSNTMAAAAMEYRREGILLGMGGRMFSVAGPIIVFGVVTGLLAGAVTAAAKGYFP